MTTTVYCAGPIKETDDPHTWRNELQEDAHEDVELINPLDLHDYADDTPSVDGPSDRDIVSNDLLKIDQADALLVYHPEECETWGTPMEMLYARQSGKIVVLGWGSETTVSPWAQVMSHYVSDNPVDGLRYIEAFFQHRSTLYPLSGENVSLFNSVGGDTALNERVIAPFNGKERVKFHE